jgi:1-phosphatidylinositol phosphodiesterase
MENLKNDYYSDSSKPKKYFSQWMKEIPDNIKISELTIPGTHDSCTYQIKGIGKLISYAARTQSWNLEEQMKAGLRYFDIRLRSYNNTLHCFHGPIDLIQTFDSILKTASDFINKNKTETLIMQIVSEYDDKGCSKSMEQMYEEYTKNYKEIIIVFNNATIPTMGELRGKLFFIKIMKGSTSRISHFHIQNSWTCNTIGEIGKKIKKIRTQFHRATSFKENKN